MPRKIKSGQKNILQMLAGRELGLERCSSVENFSQLRVLVSQSASRRFQEVPHQFSGKGFCYGQGKTILRRKLPNSERMTWDCYDLGHNRHQMIKLWSLPVPPHW